MAEEIVPLDCIRDNRNHMELVVEEVRSYVNRDFNKDGKDKRISFFEKRLDLISGIYSKLEGEYMKIVSMAERVVSVDRAFRRMVDRDWGSEIVSMVKKELEEIGRRVEGGVQAECVKVVERMRSDVESALHTIEHTDEQRAKDMGNLDRVYREKMDVLARKIHTVEVAVAGTGKFIEECKENVDTLHRGMTSLNGRMADVIGMLGSGEVNLSEQVKLLGDKVGSTASVVVPQELTGLLEEVKRTVREASQTRAEAMEVEEGGSFAEVVKRRRRAHRGPQVVLEVEKDKKVTREEVVKCLDPKRGEVRIRGIRRQGKDFVVELHAEEDLEKLKGNGGLAEVGVRVDGDPKFRMPRVIIHDVHKEIERDNLAEAVLSRNRGVFGFLSEDKISEGFVPEYIAGRKEREFRSWVVRVTPEILNRLVGEGGIYVGVRRCRVAEFIGVTRCFKCQGLGHTQRFCGNDLACGRCGVTGHHAIRCDRGENVDCVNCKRFGLRGERHPANWHGCPAVRVFKARLERVTAYS